MTKFARVGITSHLSSIIMCVSEHVRDGRLLVQVPCYTSFWIISVESRMWKVDCLLAT
jgi:hypothetical protein